MTDLSRFQAKAGKVFRHGKEIEVETLQSTTPPKRRKHLFAQIPLQSAAKVAKITRSHQFFVWIWLQHMAWKTKSRTFAISNSALAQYGIDRDSKRRALESFEAAGMISVVRHKNKAPVVTLIDIPTNSASD
jgi:hypothetical protein